MSLVVLASTFPTRKGDSTPGFVLDIAEQQTREFDVTVITPMVPGARRRERIGDVKVVRYRYFLRRWETLAAGAILDNLRASPLSWLQLPCLIVGLYVAVAKHLAREKVDAIHAHWVLPQGLVAVCGRRRPPVLVTAHGGDIYALRSRPFVRLKRAVVRRASAVTTVNQDMLSEVREWGADTATSHLLPMGAPLDDAAEAASSAIKHPGRVLAVGRMVEKKGFEVLIDAWRLMDRPQAELVIIGEGPLSESLQARAKGLNVRFFGARPRQEVLVAMASSSAFVLPSVAAASGDQEGLPVVLLEAGATGAAVVATCIAGVTDLVVDERDGLLVPPGDADALAAALRRVLDEPALARRLGESLLERVQDYGVDRIGARYSDLIASMIRAEQ